VGPTARPTGSFAIVCGASQIDLGDPGSNDIASIGVHRPATERLTKRNRAGAVLRDQANDLLDSIGCYSKPFLIARVTQSMKYGTTLKKTIEIIANAIAA
jgi:hypothetical protein